MWPNSTARHKPQFAARSRESSQPGLARAAGALLEQRAVGGDAPDRPAAIGGRSAPTHGERRGGQRNRKDCIWRISPR
jgi:hypothetical protein